MFGFLNIYKPVGMTSHDVIAILRRVLKIKQIGHAGTLDPFAQGVLPVAIGKATRLIEFLDGDKEYLAEVSFGKSTNTFDIEGDVVFETDLRICEKDLNEALEKFKGNILQYPPKFSAIKIKGKKLYEYARKGEEVQIEPRKVFIEGIELKNFDEKMQKAEILIKCSKGTYIRSIANDLGQELKTGAYLSKLIRTQAGAFFVNDSISLENISSQKVAKNALINPLEMLNLEKIIINDEEEKKVAQGQFIVNKTNFNDLEIILLIYNNEVRAIAQISGNMIKSKKVF